MTAPLTAARFRPLRMVLVLGVLFALYATGAGAPSVRAQSSSAPVAAAGSAGSEASASSDDAPSTAGDAPRPSGGGYIDQEAVEGILNRHSESLDALPEVYYNYAVLDHPSGNSVLARNALYYKLGGGDTEKGRQRGKLVELLNRQLLANADLGDTLVVPTKFGLDFRAYSPFPRYYPGARDLPKLFIMQKSVQAWAAYEYGKLTRWGIINTGKDENPTPSGRYSFNWKQRERVSTMSPPGEEWRMFWVFNFYNARGMHVHQYTMPTGGPASHGCVRLVDADARWIYNWAEPWTSSRGPIGPQSAQGHITAPGTPVLVLGKNPDGPPMPFTFKRRYPVLKRLDLPSDPIRVPAGSPWQRRFDRMAGR